MVLVVSYIYKYLLLVQHLQQIAVISKSDYPDDAEFWLF